jgi:hypothetical protein
MRLLLPLLPDRYPQIASLSKQAEFFANLSETWSVTVVSEKLNPHV